MRSLKWPIYFVLVLLLFVSVSPLIIEWYLIKCLKENGYQVKLNRFGVNYFTGEVGVSNLELIAPNGQRIHVFDGRANIAVMDSLQGNLTFDSVEINGSLLDVQSEGGELLLGGFELSALTKNITGSRQFTIARLELNDAEICETRLLQCLHIESVNTSQASATLRSGGWKLQHDSAFVLNKAFLRDLSREIATLYLDRLEVAHGQYSGSSVSLGRSHLSNFQFIQSFSVAGKRTVAKAQTQVGEMNITHLNAQLADRKSLHLGEVELISPRQSFSKQLGVSKAPFGAQTLLSQLSRQVWMTILGRGGFDFSVDKLRVQGGAITLQDLLSDPNAEESLTAIRLQTGRIDSAKPGDATPVKAKAKLGGHGQLELEGEGYPLGPKPMFKGNLNIEEWNLANIAAYTPTLFKQNLFAGVVDVAADIHYEGSVLDLDSRWRLSALKFEPSSQGSLLSKSFNLLKDHNKSVAVRMTSSGQYPTESNNLSSLLGDKLPAAMYQESQTQLGAANAEVGDKGLILGQSNRSASFKYKPIIFKPSKRLPELADQRVLWDIAELLKKKLHLKVQFCPVTTAGEWAEVFNNGVRPGEGFELNRKEQAVLTDLASARGKNLRQELMDQGVASAQLLPCEPQIDLSSGSGPFVSITME